MVQGGHANTIHHARYKTMSRNGKIISISTSMAKTVSWKGNAVATGIFKEPVQGRVAVKRLGIVGDQQADLTVHGGVDKAVYIYPSEYYRYWAENLKGRDLPLGMFGENFTTTGLFESNVSIGDKFRAGTAVLRVTQPRMPCFKLGMKFGDDRMIGKFFRSGKWGFYCAVEEEGFCEAGDELVYLSGDDFSIKVLEVVQLLLAEKVDYDQLAAVLQSNLADQMKLTVAHRLASHLE